MCLQMHCASLMLLEHSSDLFCLWLVKTRVIIKLRQISQTSIKQWNFPSDLRIA